MTEADGPRARVFVLWGCCPMGHEPVCRASSEEVSSCERPRAGLSLFRERVGLVPVRGGFPGRLGLRGDPRIILAGRAPLVIERE